MFIYDPHRAGGDLAFLRRPEMQHRDMAWIKVSRMLEEKLNLVFGVTVFLSTLLQLRPRCMSPLSACRDTEKAFFRLLPTLRCCFFNLFFIFI